MIDKQPNTHLFLQGSTLDQIPGDYEELFAAKKDILGYKALSWPRC